MSKKLEEINQIALERGGYCLSDTYTNNHTKLKFRCGKNHEWMTTPKSIKKGRWCPLCYDSEKRKAIKRQPNKILEIKQKACELGGECLSEVYINNREKLKFRCASGHEWETNWKCIIKNTWCPICASKKDLDPSGILYKELINIVNYKNGICFEPYQGAKTKIKFSCEFEHIWTATPNAIKNGNWCPQCSMGFYERVCREYFEQLWGKSFPKVKPKWLKNTNDKLLELDGFCQELNLAFEHQGSYHYKDLEVQKRDKIKIDLCLKYGVNLIVIPELNSRIKIKDLKDFIRKKCIDLNVDLPDNFDQIDVRLKKAYKPFNYTKLEELRQIAITRNGKCISTEYVDSSSKMDWFCNVCKNTWQTNSNSIQNGTWCPICAGKISINIDDICKFVVNKNMVCLSETYINNHEKLRWQCLDCSNEWQATYNAIQSGTGCPPCAIKRRAKLKTLTIDPYQEAAKRKGGKCLTTEYTGCYQKMTWECAVGHVWEARADQIKNTDRWCPIC